MSIKVADTSLEHLYPPFAELVRSILKQATIETEGKHGVSSWVMIEGYRSQARQDWLYAQGRTRKGPIVTHIKVSNHSSGLAADCGPVDIHGNVMWEAHEEIWQQYGHVIRTHKELQWGGDFPKIHPGSTFVDMPHMEPEAQHRHNWIAQAIAYLKEKELT